MKFIRRHLGTLSCVLAFALAIVASGAAHAAHEWIETHADLQATVTPASHHQPVAPHPAHDSEHCAVCIQIAGLSQFVVTSVSQAIVSEPAVIHSSSPPEISLPIARFPAPAISPRAPPIA